jgi:hypothetical protein
MPEAPQLVVGGAGHHVARQAKAGTSLAGTAVLLGAVAGCRRSAGRTGVLDEAVAVLAAAQAGRIAAVRELTLGPPAGDLEAVVGPGVQDLGHASSPPATARVSERMFRF